MQCVSLMEGRPVDITSGKSGFILIQLQWLKMNCVTFLRASKQRDKAFDTRNSSLKDIT